jgi:transcription elongation factor Elf1
MYECFHCGTKAVIWDADFDFEDYGYDGEGIVHNCHCTNCGAEIEYRVPMESDEDGTDKR